MADKTLHGKNPILWTAPIPGTAFENYDANSVLQSMSRLHKKGQYLEVKHNMDIPEFEYINVNNHFQGIKRLRMHNYIVLSGASKKSRHAHLFIIKLSSKLKRKDKSLGTNILFKAIPDKDELRTIVCIDKDEYWHAGGISLCGDVLVIPLEGKMQTAQGKRDASRIVFYNMLDPENPVVYPVMIKRRFQKAGAVSLVRLENNKFLCAVWSDSDDLQKRFDFYISKTTTFNEGFLKIASIPVKQVDKYSGREPKFQAIDFIRQKDGALFLIGFYNTRKTAPVINGTNTSIVYKVDCGIESAKPRIQLQQQYVRHYEDGKRQYNMGGATGTFVNKQGDILVYSAHHWKTKKTIKFAEFDGQLGHNNRSINSIQSASCELYEHGFFGGRCLKLYADVVTEIPTFKKIKVQGKSFNDKVSSLRFQLPANYKLTLFEHEYFKGKRTTFLGQGNVISIPEIGRDNDRYSSLKLIKI